MTNRSGKLKASKVKPADRTGSVEWPFEREAPLIDWRRLKESMRFKNWEVRTAHTTDVLRKLRNEMNLLAGPWGALKVMSQISQSNTWAASVGFLEEEQFILLLFLSIMHRDVKAAPELVSWSATSYYGLVYIEDRVSHWPEEEGAVKGRVKRNNITEHNSQCWKINTLLGVFISLLLQTEPVGGKPLFTAALTTNPSAFKEIFQVKTGVVTYVRG